MCRLPPLWPESWGSGATPSLRSPSGAALQTLLGTSAARRLAPSPPCWVASTRSLNSEDGDLERACPQRMYELGRGRCPPLASSTFELTVWRAPGLPPLTLSWSPPARASSSRRNGTNHPEGSSALLDSNARLPEAVVCMRVNGLSLRPCCRLAVVSTPPILPHLAGPAALPLEQFPCSCSSRDQHLIAKLTGDRVLLTSNLGPAGSLP